MIVFRVLDDGKGTSGQFVWFLDEFDAFGIQVCLQGCYIGNLEGQRLRFTDYPIIMLPIFVRQVEKDLRF